VLHIAITVIIEAWNFSFDFSTRIDLPRGTATAFFVAELITKVN
jgi:hypothetical protein